MSKAKEPSSGDKLIVTLSGVYASEIRRVAANFNVKPAVLVRDLVTKGLLSEYGVSVK
jgi:hypothetical protein